jgi:hypothetical protein
MNKCGSALTGHYQIAEKLNLELILHLVCTCALQRSFILHLYYEKRNNHC